MNKESQTKVKS